MELPQLKKASSVRASRRRPYRRPPQLLRSSPSPAARRMSSSRSHTRTHVDAYLGCCRVAAGRLRRGEEFEERGECNSGEGRSCGGAAS